MRSGEQRSDGGREVTGQQRNGDKPIEKAHGAAPAVWSHFGYRDCGIKGVAVCKKQKRGLQDANGERNEQGKVFAKPMSSGIEGKPVKEKQLRDLTQHPDAENAAAIIDCGSDSCAERVVDFRGQDCLLWRASAAATDES